MNLVESVVIVSERIEASASAKHIEVVIDTRLTMKQQVSNCCVGLCQVHEFWLYITKDAVVTLVNALVTARRDC